MTPTRSYLTTQYKNIHNGPTWFGPAFKTILAEIPTVAINFAPHEKAYSIGHLLKHIINWQEYVLRKMRGDEQFKIVEDSIANFPMLSEKYSEAQFEQLRATYFSHYQNILNELQTISEDWLSEKTISRVHLNWEFVQGIIHHDLYHLGQIRMLVRIFEKGN